MFGLLTVVGVAAAIVKTVDDYMEIAALSARWRDKIFAAARRHGVGPHILLSIIKKESNFNPAAVGTSGEIGLGQFLPIAARDIGVSFDALKNDPDLQIESAARLLALNISRSGGNVVTAVRAYNIGIGKAMSNASAGSAYLVDVLRLAFTDWLYTSVMTGPKIQ